MGPKEVVGPVMRRLRRELKGIGSVRYVSRSRLRIAKGIFRVLGIKKLRAMVAVQEMMYGVNTGTPTNAALASISWPVGLNEDPAVDPDYGRAGILFATPMIPMDAESVRETLKICQQAKERFSIEPAVTLNLCHDKSLEGVISVDFNRENDAAGDRARSSVNYMISSFIEAGAVSLPSRYCVDEPPGRQRGHVLENCS